MYILFSINGCSHDEVLMSTQLQISKVVASRSVPRKNRPFSPPVLACVLMIVNIGTYNCCIVLETLGSMNLVVAEWRLF